MPRFPIIALVALLPATGMAQAQGQTVPPPPVDALQNGWNNRLANSRAAQWEKANAMWPGQAQYQLNWLRSAYNARMGNNNGRLLPADKAELDSIARAIATEAPASFEAHLALYLVDFPAPEAFRELEAAHALAPDRPELISPMLTLAMRNGDADAMQRWSAELQERHAIAAPLLQAAGDVLLSIPDRAVLFVNGDMDGQPVVVEQLQHARNPNVLVVDRRLLADRDYRKRIWQAAGGKGAVPDAGPVFARQLLAKGKRPVYFALSLDASWFHAFPGQLHAVGAAFRVGAPEASDPSILAAHWSRMKKPMDAGPMSRNYLVPGAMLLAQYRAQGDTIKAGALEAELRKMADATGGLDQLRQAGVIKQ